VFRKGVYRVKGGEKRRGEEERDPCSCGCWSLEGIKEGREERRDELEVPVCKSISLRCLFPFRPRLRFEQLFLTDMC